MRPRVRRSDFPSGWHPGDVLRLALGAVITIALALLVAAQPVAGLETGVFRLVNGLPDMLEWPLWLVMQLGSLAAIPVTAGAALLARRRHLALDLAIAGGIAWSAARLVKAAVGRERPTLLVAEVLRRGPEQLGLGFPSGHVTIAAALATVASPWLPSAWRPVIWLAVGVVGLARIYIGAHLPLDAIGGVALGVAIGAVVRLCDGAIRNRVRGA